MFVFKGREAQDKAFSSFSESLGSFIFQVGINSEIYL